MTITATPTFGAVNAGNLWGTATAMPCQCSYTLPNTLPNSLCLVPLANLLLTTSALLPPFPVKELTGNQRSWATSSTTSHKTRPTVKKGKLSSVRLGVSTKTIMKGPMTWSSQWYRMVSEEEGLAWHIIVATEGPAEGEEARLHTPEGLIGTTPPPLLGTYVTEDSHSFPSTSSLTGAGP